MRSKTKLKNAAIAARSAALPSIPKELLDQFVSGPMTGAEVNAASMAFKKALIERALGAELGHHLGYPSGEIKPEATSNQRNGTSGKTVMTEDGPLRLNVPRDRDGSFEPLLIGKHERRFTGFDDKIIAMYARGMTVREVQGFLSDQYGVDVSPEFISSVTDAVMAEVGAWQSRPLEPMYPVVFFDALRVKIREDAVVRNKAIDLALGVLPDGTRDILGLWIENTEGAKFWMKVFNDLKTRGVADILIVVTDGLKGMPEALGAVYPATTLQTCIRAPDPQQPGLRELEGPQAVGRGDQADRHGYQCRGGAGRTRCLRARPMGKEAPNGRGSVAPRLGPRDPVLRVSAGCAQGDRHHERHREHQRAAAQDHQDTGALPQRRRSGQADLAGPAQHHRRLGPSGEPLERGHEPIRHPLCRPLHQTHCVR